jgi:hypothetical protein
VIQLSRIPRVLQKTVPVIYHEDKGRQVPQGTGFFLSYRNPVDSKAKFDLLVTSRHLIFDTGGNRARAFVRVNRKGEGTELIEISDDEVLLPPDPNVDLAVLPGVYPELPIDPMYIQADEFVAKAEDLQPPGFGVGAEVFYMGLFIPHVGETRNQPITRFGRVALIPDEPVLWEDTYVRVILAEMTAFRGNSGSPVFVYLGHTDSRGLPVPRLLGVLKGSFTQEHVARITGYEETFRVENTAGIAAIVPAVLLDNFVRQEVIPRLLREAPGGSSL